jgi:uncharacterized protein
MHVNVREFLAEDVGYRRSFAITGEEPHLEGLQLTKPINGEVMISRIDDGVLVEGHAQTELELVCDRCLRSFTRPANVKFERIYRDSPDDDDLPIDRHDDIDLAPLIGQELVVSLPIKLLDRPDCPGIEGQILATEDAPEPSLRVGDRARIKKG